MSDEEEGYTGQPLDEQTPRQAMLCVINMLDAMVATYENVLEETGRESRQPSFDEAQEEAKLVARQLIHDGDLPPEGSSEWAIDDSPEFYDQETPRARSKQPTPSPARSRSPGRSLSPPNRRRSPTPVETPEEHARVVLYKRFWLKNPPKIDIRDYLLRFDRYCESSVSTYLAAGYYVYQLCVVQKKLPLSRLNVHRLFSAAFVVAAKVVEDVLYPWSRFATTAGVSRGDLGKLEIALLYLLDFNVRIDRHVLEESLEDWSRFEPIK